MSASAYKGLLLDGRLVDVDRLILGDVGGSEDIFTFEGVSSNFEEGLRVREVSEDLDGSSC